MLVYNGDEDCLMYYTISCVKISDKLKHIISIMSDPILMEYNSQKLYTKAKLAVSSNINS